MRDSLYVLGLCAATSWLAYLAGRRWAGLGRRGLAPAVARLLECLGLVAGFYALNLALGFLVVVAARRVTGAFVSLYLVTDLTLALLSVLQAITFQWWRAESE